MIIFNNFVSLASKFNINMAPTASNMSPRKKNQNLYPCRSHKNNDASTTMTSYDVTGGRLFSHNVFKN